MRRLFPLFPTPLLLGNLGPHTLQGSFVFLSQATVILSALSQTYILARPSLLSQLTPAAQSWYRDFHYPCWSIITRSWCCQQSVSSLSWQHYYSSSFSPRAAYYCKSPLFLVLVVYRLEPSSREVLGELSFWSFLELHSPLSKSFPSGPQHSPS